MTAQTRESIVGRQFRGEARRRNISALRIAAVIGYTLVPAFWVLDWVIIPGFVWELLGIRLALASYALWLHYAVHFHRDWAEANDIILTQSLALLVAWAIEIMVFMDAGYSSPYYAGICLVVVTVGFLFSWAPVQAISFYSLLYVPFLAPAALGLAPVIDLQTFLVPQIFLLSTMAIVYVSQRFRYSLEAREFFANERLRAATSSLEEALKRLREADEAKDEFFSNITHELRTPLTMILAPLEAVRAGELGKFEPRAMPYFDAIWNNALRLLRLINDLLDLAKMGDGALAADRHRSSMQPMLTAIVNHAGPLAARKGVTLTLDVHDDPSDLYVDTDLVERAVINLLSNALKFSEEGQAVTVRLTVDAGWALISVEDAAGGIPKDKLGAIFERFVQADGSVTRAHGGSGLGLPIAREIAQLHGGKLTVESTEGAGSTFTIALPLGAPDGTRFDGLDGPEESGRGAAEWSRQLVERSDYRFLRIEEVTERRLVKARDDEGKATKVLVVEDNVEILRFIHLQLTNEHAVYLARDGQQGLELAREHRPDVIISDHMMPVMDGLTMLEQLRQQPETRNIPVIMLTARGAVEDRVNAREGGADTYLTKPFSPRELRSAIQALMKRRTRSAHELMRAQNQSLELISAGLAHELNNPLSYIKNACHMMARDAATIGSELDKETPDKARLHKAHDRIQRMGEVSERGIKRIENIVALVRRYAREGYPEEPTEISLDQAVGDVAALVGPRDGRRVAIQLELHAGGARVRCIPEELHQAIGNLIQNAIDVVPENGHVRVRTCVSANSALLEVIDNGPGIPRADLQRIFAPFYSTKGPQGMGVGLAITEKVVRGAGGAIEVDSTIGVGSTFRVRLPLVA